jgi:hypothetical protein
MGEKTRAAALSDIPSGLFWSVLVRVVDLFLTTAPSIISTVCDRKELITSKNAFCKGHPFDWLQYSFAILRTSPHNSGHHSHHENLMTVDKR